MISLSKILNGVSIKQLIGSMDVTVHAVRFDSRQVVDGDLFVAVRGTLTDGHVFIDKAVALGAKIVVCEQLPQDLSGHITYIQVENAGFALGLIAANFYDNPSAKLKLVGVTGTNGKTTVATLLYKLFVELGFRVGLISTVQNKVNERVIESIHTTTDPISLNEILCEIV